MEFEPMLTPREKSPLPENVPRGVSNPRHCGSEPKHYQLSYSGPVSEPVKLNKTDRQKKQTSKAKQEHIHIGKSKLTRQKKQTQEKANLQS